MNPKVVNVLATGGYGDLVKLFAFFELAVFERKRTFHCSRDLAILRRHFEQIWFVPLCLFLASTITSSVMTSLRNPILWLALVLLANGIGCGTTTKRLGTEQVLLSTAVDEAVSQIDFGVLAGRRVFLDTSFMQHVKSPELCQFSIHHQCPAAADGGRQLPVDGYA